jgi:hypothetical protein
MTTYDSDPPSKRWALSRYGSARSPASCLSLPASSRSASVVFATIISVKLIGVTAIVAGAFEIMHAFWTKGCAAGFAGGIAAVVFAGGDVSRALIATRTKSVLAEFIMKTIRPLHPSGRRTR